MPSVSFVDSPPSTDFGLLREQAMAGSERAWHTLVDTLKGVAWKVLNSYDISAEDRNDAFASTFFRLFERLDSIREPAKLPGWVATTARNEANAAYRRRAKVSPMADVPMRGIQTPDPGERMEDDELHSAMHQAFARLSPDHQALMRLVTADPPIPYEDISRLLGIPIGSIGPTRQRCLQRLRSSPELIPFMPGGLD